ncbi:MAG: SH3 domain-containing protein [Kiritimatiellia bacterium]
MLSFACLQAACAADLPVFAELHASRTAPYAGEAFDLTLTLYVADNALDRQVQVAGLPETLTHTPFEERAGRAVERNGRTWTTRPYVCRARIATPGELIISPQLDGQLVRVQRTWFFNQTVMQPVRIPLPVPLALAVRALPAEHRPRDFSEAVGRFSLNVAAEPTEVAVGDLITVRLTVTGDGALDTAAPPCMADVTGFRVYPLRPDSVPVPFQQRRTYTQTLVPLTPAATLAPAYRWTSFDPVTDTYRVLTAGPFPIVFHAERAFSQEVYRVTGSGQIAAPSVPDNTGTTTNAPPLRWYARVPLITWPIAALLCLLCAALAGLRAILPEQVRSACNSHERWTLAMLGALIALGVVCSAWHAARVEQRIRVVSATCQTAGFAPYEDAATVGTLRAGERVRVLETHGSWLRVMTPDGGGGWIPETALRSQ